MRAHKEIALYKKKKKKKPNKQTNKQTKRMSETQDTRKSQNTFIHM